MFVFALLAALLAVALGAEAGLAVRPYVLPEARFVSGLEDAARDQAVDALLDRREQAVRDRDPALFLADVDTADPAFVRHQKETYDNIVKLSTVAYLHDLQADGWHTDARWDRRIGGQVFLAKVAVRYRIGGFDAGIVAAPWVPAFVRRGDTWRLVGQATGPQYPMGTGAQLWDAGPLAVHRAGEVMVVGSAADANRLRRLADLARTGMRKVPALVTGWPQRMVLVAVRDRKVLAAFLDDEDPDDFAGIAIPQYDGVPEWLPDSYPELAAGRVILHPDELTTDDAELVTLIAHEFTHIAMLPWTFETTPTWLSEGFASYIAERDVPSSTYLVDVLRAAADDGGLPVALPGDITFYGDDAELNYAISWAACQYLSERYGEAKLIALYRWLADEVDASDTLGPTEFVDRGLRAVVGVDLDRFTRDVFAHADRLTR